MRRREFIALIGGATSSASLSVRAQQPFRVGLLETGGDTSFFIVPFSRKLEELGYLEGKNLIIHRKRAEGNTSGRCLRSSANAASSSSGFRGPIV